MKTITLITVTLLWFTLYASAQIKTESVDIIEVPQISPDSGLNASTAGWLMIVMIDSIVYELDSISFDVNITDRAHGITTVHNVDEGWVHSISMINDNKTKEKYGYKCEKGVIIIRLSDSHQQDFIEGKNVTRPLKIMR